MSSLGKTLLKATCTLPVKYVRVCVRKARAGLTDEGGDAGVDDAAGEEVKVVLHRVHHHRVPRVIAPLRREGGTGVNNCPPGEREARGK